MKSQPIMSCEFVHLLVNYDYLNSANTYLYILAHMYFSTFAYQTL